MFDRDRRARMLETIKRLNVRDDFFAPVLYVTPAGEPVQSGAEDDSEVHWAYDEYDFRLYVTILLLIQFIEHGDRELALGILEKYHDKVICERGLSWNNPEHTEGREMTPYGYEDAHNLIVWSLPTLLIDGSIGETCAPGGFAHRILAAGKDHMVRARE